MSRGLGPNCSKTVGNEKPIKDTPRAINACKWCACSGQDLIGGSNYGQTVFTALKYVPSSYVEPGGKVF